MLRTIRTLIFLAMIVCLSFPIYAQDTSPQCLTEPTDVTIAYGDSLSCAIDPIGDSDVFRFFGNTGDRIIAETQDIANGSGFQMCIELISPEGATLADQCTTAEGERIDIVLTLEGAHTLIVHDFEDDRAGRYQVSLSCLLGICTPPEGNPDIAVTPPNFDFVPVNLDTESAPVRFLVSNGMDPANAVGPRLTINPITLAGTDANEFTIRADTCSNRFVPAGFSCVVEVGFTPTSLGTKTAMLLIPSNDPDTPLTEVNLSGVGQGGTLDPIGGSVTAVSPTTIVCANLTSGQSVLIPNSATFWDCEASGLTANPGDEILQSVLGTAE